MNLPSPPRPDAPGSLSEEWQQTAHDAAEAAKGYASEAQAVARSAAESIRPALDDASALVGEARGTVAGLVNDVVDIATDTLANGRQRCREAIARHPYQAMLIVAGLGAVAALALRSALMPRRHP